MQKLCHVLWLHEIDKDLQNTGFQNRSKVPCMQNAAEHDLLQNIKYYKLQANFRGAIGCAPCSNENFRSVTSNHTSGSVIYNNNKMIGRLAIAVRDLAGGCLG